ncbi:MAG: DUF4293 domain-containing protein [Muribaculaceae bacterium]|nr:DUF4293 domain-containing protein [Muribaculaceae bacterium]
MVIQRWQSVLLLLASVFMGAYSLLPAATLYDSPDTVTVFPIDFPGNLIGNIIIALLLFASIFLYRNTRLQRRMLAGAMILMLISAACGFLAIGPLHGTEPDIVFGFSCCFLPLALIATFMAYRRILADEKLLRSYDRLR